MFSKSIKRAISSFTVNLLLISAVDATLTPGHHNFQADSHPRRDQSPHHSISRSAQEQKSRLQRYARTSQKLLHSPCKTSRKGTYRTYTGEHITCILARPISLSCTSRGE